MCERLSQMFSIVNFSRLHIHIRAHQSLIILGHSGILSILYNGPKRRISINEADWRFLLFSRTGMLNILWYKSTSQQWEGDYKKIHLVSVVIEMTEECDVFPFMMIFINCTVTSMFGTATMKTWLCFAYWKGLIRCTDKVTQTRLHRLSFIIDHGGADASCVHTGVEFLDTWWMHVLYSPSFSHHVGLNQFLKVTSGSFKLLHRSICSAASECVCSCWVGSRLFFPSHFFFYWYPRSQNSERQK